jgi:S-(hydroxymethyl)glutathione dehydrogenase/alcohol dehydrogenase
VKAALLRDFNGAWELEDVQIDDPIGDEVLIEVRASGLCHSDLLTATADRGLKLPVLCGHEVSGVVTAVGPLVRGVAIGDHVTTCVAGACEVCALCQSGRPWLCAARSETDHFLEREPGLPPRLTASGDPVTAVAAIGGFAEQALVPERALVGIDRAIPFEVAAVLGCAVVTGVGAAVKSATIRPGETVVVIGCGGVGLNVIQGARLRGAGRIVGVDLSPGRLARAELFGATDLVDASSGMTLEQVRELLPSGVDHAFEVVGSQATMTQALGMLGPGGTAYAIGAAPKLVPLSAISAQELLAGGKSIVGVYAGSTSFKHDIPAYADMYLRGLLQVDPLISERIGLADVTEAYRCHDNTDSARAVIVF